MISTKKLSKLLPGISSHELGGVNDFNLMAWMCQRSFLAFCCAMVPAFQDTRIHTMLAHELQQLYEDVALGIDRKIEICVQPQLGKSTITSVLFAAWVLGLEAWPVICASYGASLAERKSQECRDIVDSEMYKIVFPNVRLHPDSTSKEFWRTTRGGSYRAVGVGGGLTGMSGKILIADDLFAGAAEAASDTVTSATRDWWNTVFYTRKQSKSGFCLINTRWSLKDISAYLEEKEESDRASGLPEGSFDTWKRLRFAAVAMEDEYSPDGTLFRREGEVLCPERFTREDMIKTKNALTVYEWQALFQQSPILNEDAEFKSPWFRYFEEKDIDDIRSQLDVYVAVDLAIAQAKHNDNTSIQVIGKLRDAPEWYHLEEYTGKWDPAVTIEILFKIKKTWKDQLRCVGIESVGFQRSLRYQIEEIMKKTGDYFVIEDLKNTGKKEDRIRGLIPLYKTGVILHRKGVDNDLEKELLQFPRGKFDDRIDSLANCLQLVRNTKSIRTGHQFRPALKRY